MLSIIALLMIARVAQPGRVAHQPPTMKLHRRREPRREQVEGETRPMRRVRPCSIYGRS